MAGRGVGTGDQTDPAVVKAEKLDGEAGRRGTAVVVDVGALGEMGC